MIDYNIEAAHRITDETCNKTGLDLTHKTRKERNVYIRVFLYKRLKYHNLMNDRKISHFLAIRGLKTDRSSVFAALNKSDTYYLNFPEYRSLHNEFFSVPSIYKKQLEKEENKRDIGSKKAKLYRLIDGLDESKIQEIEEMLELKIKSFSWKNKDKYEVISCEV